MTWGVPRRPKISNKLGRPTPGEGSDGDIQVRQTGVGARLFAKLGGRWFSNTLSDDSKFPMGAVFTPKAWVFEGTLADPSPPTTTIDLPNFIPVEDVLYIGFGIQFRGTAGGYGFFKTGGTATEHDGSSDFYEDIDVEVFLLNNKIRILSDNDATSLAAEKFRLTVFFK